MKLRPYYSAFFVICCAMLCALSVSAQEGRTQGEIETAVKETPHSEPDPVLNSESESRNVNKVTTQAPMKEAPRDSVQVKITKPTTKATEKEQKEEDPLSFNFLYYIIEKFKLSDIIE